VEVPYLNFFDPTDFAFGIIIFFDYYNESCVILNLALLGL